MWYQAISAVVIEGFRSKVFETAIGQFVALVAFFAFPAIQYLSLKWFSRNEGHPQLWYLPATGFRLVIRNLPRKRTLSAIKYRALLRSVVRHSPNSVATFEDQMLVQNEDFFVFPGTDQILVCFQLRGKRDSDIDFVLTDKLGNEKKKIPLSDFDRLICDYTATLENAFSFNIRLSKRAEVTVESLKQMWTDLQTDNSEGSYEIDRIRSVG